MYKKFFRLTAQPFTAAPIPANYFAGAAIEQARQTLHRCVERAEGAAMVVGAVGTGKTLLCRLMADQLAAHYEIVQLTAGAIAHRRGLYQAILRELRLPFRLEEGELRLSLADYISHGPSTRSGMVILVDEAQSLSLGLLEELRLLTNLFHNGQPWVRLILFGGTELEERFASPRMESFNQRVAARCYLQAFDQAETQAYVAARVAACGAQPEAIFVGDATQRVFQATDGIPRLVNQVCDHALLLAFAGGVRAISGDGIEEAWADLQQLPTPARTTLRFEAPHEVSNVIEFGALDDDEPAPAIAGATALEVALQVAPAVPSTVEPIIDPSRQLERIEAHLGRLEQEFQQEAAMKPYGFSFREPTTKTGYAFDQEEVIVDRYAELDALSVSRPRVHSREGRTLWPLLEPFAEAPVQERPRLAVAATEEPSIATVAAPTGQTPLSVRAEQEAVHSPFPGESIRETATLEQPILDESDDDLFVIEEDVDTQTISTVPKKAPVRRQEYGQLFAKLRRG